MRLGIWLKIILKVCIIHADIAKWLVSSIVQSCAPFTAEGGFVNINIEKLLIFKYMLGYDKSTLIEISAYSLVRNWSAN